MEKISEFLGTTTSINNRNNITTNAYAGSGNSEIENAIRKQLELGQRSTVNGVWLRDWIDVQEEYLKSVKSRKSSKVLLIRLSLLVQNMTHATWKTRNEAVHKNDESEMNKKQHEDLDVDITNMFRDLSTQSTTPPTCIRCSVLLREVLWNG
jgi:hypothetical protein